MSAASLETEYPPLQLRSIEDDKQNVENAAYAAPDMNTPESNMVRKLVDACHYRPDLKVIDMKYRISY